MAKKKKEEVELYYVIEKVKIINKPGAVLILQSGSGTPPPKPPKP